MHRPECRPLTNLDSVDVSNDLVSYFQMATKQNLDSFIERSLHEQLLAELTKNKIKYLDSSDKNLHILVFTKVEPYPAVLGHLAPKKRHGLHHLLDCFVGIRPR